LVSPTTITFTAAVAANAPTEPDALALVCLGVTANLDPGSVEITPCAIPITPAISSIQASSWIAGQSTPITITGTGFISTTNPNGCPQTQPSVTAGTENVALSNINVVSATQIIATVTPKATDPAETATVTVSNFLYNGPPDSATAMATAQILPAPKVTLQRIDLMDILATGTPMGGTFSLTTQSQSGTTNAAIGFAAGVNATTNPNTLHLTDPDNPSGQGAPSPGGQEQVTVNYTAANSKASDSFQVPVFGMSCYYKTVQSDWGTAPNGCSTTTIDGIKYSGTVKNPVGLTGTYCSSFIAQVELQGSGVLNTGQEIQYVSKKLVDVSTVETADGTPPVAGQTVARDRSIIPGRGVLIDLDQVGTGLLANDTGGGITGYRIDLYNGVGEAVCVNYENVMTVGACTPGTSGCPASAVQ
jgi:3D (Asp-Asp-Asp) domain-containing protein